MAIDNNIIAHISDDAKYVKFDPTNTSFPTTIKDVQAALAALNASAIEMKIASETELGVIMLASDADITAGTNKTKAVTPAQLKSQMMKPLATETVAGIIRIATQQESNAATLDNVALTPKKFITTFNAVTSQENRQGTIKLSTQAAAELGTDHTTAMTPLRVKQAIQKHGVQPGTATETQKGLVQLATWEQTREGVVRDGYAVSPYAFARATADTTKVGTVRIATNDEVRARQLGNVAVSPAGLAGLIATDQAFGLTKLVTQPNPNNINTALAGNANVMLGDRTLNGRPLKDNIWLTAADVWCWNRDESDARYQPRGTMYSSRCVAGQIGGAGWSEYTQAYGDFSHVVIDVSVFFDMGDGSQNRFMEFVIDLHDGNGEWLQMAGPFRISQLVEKGGRSGHYWGYQGNAVGFYHIGIPTPGDPNKWQRIQPNHRFRIRPIGADRTNSYHFKMTFSQ